jgi:hypothetical protein
VPTTTTSEGRATTVAPLVCEPGLVRGKRRKTQLTLTLLLVYAPNMVFKCCALGDRIAAPVKGNANSQTEKKWVSLGLGLGLQEVKKNKTKGKAHN